MTDARTTLYHRHRFPAEIIAEAVWLYFRFPLSFRMVEDMLAYKGIIVTHKTVRQWAEKFGRDYANKIRRRTPRLGDKWHLDEAVISINGKKHFLWRAVDQDGFVLEVLVQSRRDTKAAKRLIRKLLTKSGCAPRVMITDKLGSYAAACTQIGLTSCDHRQHKGLNNRAENSHQPIRRRERIMKRFKSTRQLQRFISIHDPIANLHHIPRNKFSSSDHHQLRQAAMTVWQEIACVKTA
ncbi:IS6 family transposase [Phyllobacterium brassicacearum]|uniref:IS6 family transposase n=1 Tax=Phyllobacterium brassicacearum TaxID=314235 RepID=A0A2P7B868_9HYPH|nr:IS6 family transposase [Phyllobacterium brassicacearum]PSH62646.1 IS6 family transposase [Phyllobacterium brassicacearum]TDQ14855.1 putative transposase [Phyllobacterium brassicacearum]